MSEATGMYSRSSIEMAAIKGWGYGNQVHDIYYGGYPGHMELSSTPMSSFRLKPSSLYKAVCSEETFQKEAGWTTSNEGEWSNLHLDHSSDPILYTNYSTENYNPKFFETHISITRRTYAAAEQNKKRKSKEEAINSEINCGNKDCQSQPLLWNKQDLPKRSHNENIPSSKLSMLKMTLKIATLDHNSENIRLNRLNRSNRIHFQAMEQLLSDQCCHQHHSCICSNSQDHIKIITITGIAETTPLREVCNLFSNYGDVKMLTRHQGSGEIYCNYYEAKSVQSAKKFLDMMKIKESVVRITLLCDKMYEQICNSTNPSSIEQLDMRLVTNRFKNKCPRRVNCISRYLHIAIFFKKNRRFVSDQLLLSAISRYCQPIGLRRDKNVENRNMWFVDCSSIYDACQAIMRLHNATFMEGHLRVSFTSAHDETTQ